jgi:hypothetical protein
MNTSVFNKNNLKTVALLSSLAGALVVFGGAFGRPKLVPKGS